MHKFDVCVFGSAMIDFISYVNGMPRRGETIHSTKFEIGFGGKGSNQVIAASRLGCRTAMIGKVGKDPYGLSYKEHFIKQGVNTDFLEQVEGYSGIALIVVDTIDGNNQIVINGNANESLCVQDVINAKDILNSSQILICQLEVPLEATIEALKNFQGFSILNAAPAMENLPEITFGLANIFCVNELEAEALTKIKFKEINDAKIMLENLLTKGCQCVIITLGKYGAIVNAESGKIYHVPVPKKMNDQIQVQDSTGAGDAFIGSLAYFIAKFPQATLLQKVGASIMIATHSVQYKGTQSSYINFPPIDPTKEHFDFIEL